MSCCTFKSWGCSKNGGFRSLAQHHMKEQVTGISGTAGMAGLSKRLKNRKADCFTLLRRITELKCVNSKVRSVDINPTKEVPSIGSMAPCRSHHGNHTRQEWIIIWSGRNWILKQCSKLKNVVVGVLGLAPCHHGEKKPQVRPDDQSGYPPNSWIASLAVDSWVGHCPLH